MSHPFFAPTFPVAWSTLTPEHIEPDVREAIRLAEARLAAIKSVNPEQSTFETTIGALENLSEELNRAWGRVNHLDSVSNSPELRAALNKMLPVVSEFGSSISLDADLWKVLKNFAESEKAKSLSPIRTRLVEETVADFESSGADLPDDKKARMRELNNELASVTQKFGENVLDSTNAWDLFIEDEARLAGLPESAKEAMAADAEEKGQPGKWRVTLQFPSMFPVMQHADDEALRKEVWEASTKIGAAGEHDNSELVAKILKLRAEKAQLLGFENFPDHILARRMAKNGAGALDFTHDLHQRVAKPFKEEAAELAAFKARETGHGDPENPPLLEPWQTAYWAEKQRRKLYDFDEEELRPYFPVKQVMNGLFTLTSRLFGLEIIEKEEVETWHPEVKFYEIHDAESDQHLGSFYADWHPRESKRGGAWMNYLETGTPPAEGRERTPHLGLICGNMTKPSGKRPALLTHREVETIFHEFGHLLHHLLSEVEVKSLAGVNVPWDFVELPSQIMENFCWDRESLDLFARHHETGEAIPEALFQKMLASRNYLAASAFMRQLAQGKLDLELHRTPEKFQGRDWNEVDREILEGYRAPLATEAPTIIPRFSHLFSSPVGYAAGYYSYKWAEVLDADAFTRFQEEGVLNPETGKAFREEILARGTPARSKNPTKPSWAAIRN